MTKRTSPGQLWHASQQRQDEDRMLSQNVRLNFVLVETKDFSIKITLDSLLHRIFDVDSATTFKDTQGKQHCEGLHARI